MLGAAGLRVVAGDRTGFAVADGDHAVAHHAARVEVVGHRLGALLRKLLVVAVGTDAVGMAGHFDDGLVVLLQRAGDVVEHRVELRLHFGLRSEEHTSELQSLMRTSYAGFCLKKKRTSAMENMGD